MGCKLSIRGDLVAQRAMNRELDAQLKKSHATEKSVIKILLLGAGEAGKSTIIKQMKIIHNNGFDDEELIEGKRIIHDLLFKRLLRVLIEDSSVSENITSEDRQLIEEASAQESPHLKSHFEAYHRVLNKNEEIIHKMSPIKEHHFLRYFLSDFQRIMDIEYIPSLDDFLRLRQRTSGIIEHFFKVNFEITKGYPTAMTFRMIDVGGQRNERRKWIHCFEGVHAILFIVSLAEYDQTLEEDLEVNRMSESLSLFAQIFGNPLFATTGFILFLNKTDIFEKKILASPLSICFPEYNTEGKEGSILIEDAKNYILSKFMAESRVRPLLPPPRLSEKRKSSRRGSTNPKSKPLYHHFTCATDTMNIRFIFSSITEMIIRNALERTQLI